MTAARNSTTGTVHNAKTETIHGATGLVQTCGFTPSQFMFLDATADAVTCRKCLAAAKPVKIAKPAPARYGRQEYSMGELKEAAKLNGVKAGRKTGDELLAEIIEIAPQYA